MPSGTTKETVMTVVPLERYFEFCRMMREHDFEFYKVLSFTKVPEEFYAVKEAQNA